MNIYLFGSHSFGCATAASDYDFLIVLKQQNVSGEDHLFHDCKHMSCSNLLTLRCEAPKMDLVLLSEQGFETALREHVIWVVQVA